MSFQKHSVRTQSMHAASKRVSDACKQTNPGTLQQYLMILYIEYNIVEMYHIEHPQYGFKSLPAVTRAIRWHLNKVGADIPLPYRHILQSTIFNRGCGQLMNGSLTLHCIAPDLTDLHKYTMYLEVV